ncbi:MAG: protein kinase domain-containing protein [Pseudomonadota bacterium]
MPQAAATADPRARDALVVGRYRPVRPLGTGASGSVWLARDEASGLDVALKIVAREGTAGARAEREAVAAARLRHERCLRCYGVGRDDRHVYIAYEYIPGRTVREAMRAGDLGDGGAIETAAQLLDGLAHAHARGIVHRDVKPANVLLRDGAGVDVKILDFGLAQFDAAETLTNVGDVPGTLAYISPERLGGATATPAADVWAVGVMLWEALAGAHPFWKGSAIDSARAIEQGAPPLRSIRPDLPKPLAAAVDAALAVDPRRRPPAEAFAAALRRTRPARRARRVGRVTAPPGLSLAVPAGVRDRLLPAGLAGVAAAAAASALPLYPVGWAPALGALAGLLSLGAPRAGLAVALALPVLPLGNLSLGLALAYAVAAAAWLAVFAREPRWALLPALGPVLGALGLLGLLPLAAMPIRSPLRRALAAAAAVVLAALAAGYAREALPLGAGAPPLGLGIAGSDDAGAVGTALVDAARAYPDLLLAGLVLAAVAAALPFARTRWQVTAVAAVLLAGTLLAAPASAAAPVVVAAWATWAACVVRRAT